MKRLSAVFTFPVLVFALAGGAHVAGPAAAAARAPEALTIPLYRYQAKNGSGVYAAYPAYRETFEKASNNWNKFGVVGHVYPSKQPGTMPLLALRKPAAVGIGSLHFYTTSIDEALEKQNGGWEAVQSYKGVIGYVSTTQQPGTVAVYRYRQPTPEGGYVYAFGESENSALKQSAGLKFEKVAFYVWANPVEKPTQANFPTGQSNFPAGGPGDKPTQSNFPSGGPGDKPAATVDLLMRQALYFNGASAAKVDTASKYATPDKAMTLKKSEALSCSGEHCTFNLGFFVQRSDGGGALTSFAQVGGPGLDSVGNSFSFAAGSRSRDFVVPVKLKSGVNRLRVEVDPSDKTPETNEANNSFTVTITVEQ